MAGIADQVRKGSLWVGSARVVVSLLGVLSTIVLARLLTPEDFGLVAIGTTVLLISNSLTALSLANALIHHEKPERNHIDCAWTLGFLRGAILAQILWALAPFISDFYEDRRLVFVIEIIALSLFLSGLANPKLALLTRDLQFWQDFVLQASQKLATVIVSITMAIIFKTYVALLGGIVAGQFCALVVSYVFVPHRPRFRLKETKELWSFSSWLMIDQFLLTLIWRMDPLIIGRFVGTAQLGLYSLSHTISGIPSREVTRTMGGALFPAFRQIKDDKARLQRAYLRAQSTIVALALPAGVLLAAVAEPLVRLALGEKWLGAVSIIQILSIFMALQAIGSASRPLAMALGKTKLLFQRTLIAATYRVPVVVGCLAFGGLEAYLVGFAVLVVMGVLLDLNVVWRAAGVSFGDHVFTNWRSFISAIAAFLVASGVILCLGDSIGTLGLAGAIVATVSLGGGTYFVLMFGIWNLTGRKPGAEEEIVELLSKLQGRFASKKSAQLKRDGR